MGEEDRHIHMEAMTDDASIEEAQQQMHQQESSSEAMKEVRIRIILKAKEFDDFKLIVRPIVHAFRSDKEIEPDREVFLSFDGDRLMPEVQVGETEISDLDVIDREMKLLTVNFLTCAVKACKTSPKSFPLHFQDAELEQREVEYNPAFVQNILPRLDWEAIKTVATERHKQLGFPHISAAKPESSSSSNAADCSPADEREREKTLRDLHALLLETEVREGKMVCGNCGHEYRIKDGIPNFLLPNHLGKKSSFLNLFFPVLACFAWGE
ncbi:MAG: hypothetical protein Q9214_002664 [Letrouitia sp. 1 TL-2023]